MDDGQELDEQVTEDDIMNMNEQNADDFNNE